MEMNIVNAVSRPRFSIQPVKNVHLNPRESHQEQYAAKKKPDKPFAEILSSEIASIKTSPTQTTQKSMTHGLSGLNSLALQNLY